MTKEEQLELFAYYEPVSLSDPRDQSIAEMVDEFAVAADQPKDILMSKKLVLEEFQELVDEWSDSASKPENRLKEMGDLVYVLFANARAEGYDLEEAVKRIHKNNMGRMFQPDGTIKRRDDGKILKNKEYPKVYLKDLT